MFAEPHDPWSTVDTSSAFSNVPEIYASTFQDANPINGFVHLSELTKILEEASLSQVQTDKILSLVGDKEELDKNDWYTALALASFTQRGSSDLHLDMVEFAKNSLPVIRLPNRQTPEITESHPESHEQEDVWQNSFDASLYNPLSKNTIALSVAPKKEGTFLFRHVNYILEGTFGAQSVKVIRRYSDFIWLLECLQKKYPFRLLPILPPKRLSGKWILYIFCYKSTVNDC